MTDRNEALAIEGIELAARRDNWAATPPELVEALGIEMVFDSGTGLFGAKRLASLFFNRVFGAGLGAALDGAALDRIAAFYRERAISSYVISLCPFAAPEGVEATMVARGFGTRFRLVKWVRDAAPAGPVRTDLRVARAGAADAARFGAVFEEAFRDMDASGAWAAAIVGRPGWTHWLAYNGETPAACAATYHANGVGWLGWGGTLPSHRGRGAQSALIAARINALSAEGCRVITVETAPDPPEKPNPSYRNVERAGFRLAYYRPSWVWPDPTKREVAEA